jgi:hypothetical protein
MLHLPPPLQHYDTSTHHQVHADHDWMSLVNKIEVISFAKLSKIDTF